MAIMRHGLIPLAALVAGTVALRECPDTSSAEYDYIVVGAGAGGGPVAARLAETGFSVLVVDVGHDVNNYNTTIPNYLARVLYDPQIELSYTLNEYPKGFPYTRDDVWYPRGRALGGSAIHNAVVNNVANTRRDFANLESMFGQSWEMERLRKLFVDIEDNLYIPNHCDKGNGQYSEGMEHDLQTSHVCDHGYHGWLKTNTIQQDILAKFNDAQLNNITAGLLSAAPFIPDLNSRASVDATGFSLASNTIDENNARSSVYNRLVAVRDAHPDRLQFAYDTLATKILLCKDCDGEEPRAVGVEIARGQGLPVQSDFHRKRHLKTEKVFARNEVIVAAGTFQTPQLLMLSGIGDKEQLCEFGIDSVVHLPGVGKNLQGASRLLLVTRDLTHSFLDHDEISTTWLLKDNHTLVNGCTFGSDPATDPCLADYLATRKNIYGLGIAIGHITYKSDDSLEEPDMDIYWAPAYFPGFVRNVGDLITHTPNALTAVALRAHPSSRGTVALTGSHPQDELRIDKNHFQNDGGATDVAALRDGVKMARAIVESSANIAPFVTHELFPGANYTTDEDIEMHVYEHVFGELSIHERCV
ncbi:hypothetical protein BD626DRAFT_265448 [Schizophyllum amplum]|uniref:Glucose-methanol-choline oxidoreductase N-terminal domain-containing protein n=1 Tax=Schizophyllum amplum TaxID=97359 RepID=A0A550CH41_9AGAR|nr:hypothetical protein BD626DRAFT_265448 [Auriculariopsis ampla]